MNRRLVPFVMVALTGLMFLTVGLLTAQDTPEEIMIFNKDYKRKLYKPVRFAHLEHAEDYGIECNECHHNYQGGENVWQEGNPVKNCIACHNPNRKQAKVHRLVFAYHFNCKKCHKEAESGPIECKECHTKIRPGT